MKNQKQAKAKENNKISGQEDVSFLYKRLCWGCLGYVFGLGGVSILVVSRFWVLVLVPGQRGSERVTSQAC